jgi:prolyl-tRNA editing enzyme YbaK/EbsC (Cys-tRNA(Pro) deacylase)
MKTNAARLLDKLGIPYQILSYEVNPDDLAALSTAQKVGLPPEQVFKTLVVRGDTTELHPKLALSAISQGRLVPRYCLHPCSPFQQRSRFAFWVF